MAQSNDQGRRFEKAVLAVFEKRPLHYEVKEQSLLQSVGSNSKTIADLVVIYKDGWTSIPILVECKSLAYPARQALVKVLGSDVGNHRASVGLIVTETTGLQAGAE